MSDTTAPLCARCGSSFERRIFTKRYCSERCRRADEEARRLARRRDERPERLRHASQCRGCGASEGMGWWIGRMAHPGAASARCHPCYLEYTRSRQNPRGHGRLIGPPKPRPKKRRNNQARAERAASRRLVVCGCGEVSTRRNASTTCPTCARANQRAAEVRRRDAIRNGDATINWRDLGAYDHWNCHICGLYVLPIAGTPDEPWGATVDHIVPLAKDGEHRWTNVQIAHRFCNIRRGAKDAEPFSLDMVVWNAAPPVVRYGQCACHECASLEVTNGCP